MNIINSFEIENETFYFYDINKVINGNEKLKRLPIVLKILLESNLRNSKDEIEFNKIINIFSNRINTEINFCASRGIMQNYSAISTLVDLASIRDIVKAEGGNVEKINPQITLDLIMDQSLEENNSLYDVEVYEFIKWAQNAFSKLRVVPPGSGICNRINLEYLSTILHLEKKDEKFFLYPETIIATDSNNRMLNSLGVLGLAIDGIDLLSTILGLPITLNFPKIIGMNIDGDVKEGVTSSDLISVLINKLKEHDLNGEIVEFYGVGLKHISLEDRSEISSLSPQYGAICSFFAIDDKTISYFDKTRESDDYGKLIKTYLKKQCLYSSEDELDYDKVINIDLSILSPKINGPKKVQEIVNINNLKESLILNRATDIKDMDIVLAEIYSCAINSNPYLLIPAALIAKKSLEFGLKINKHIKASLYLNSFIITEYLEKLDLLKYFETLGFEILTCEDSTNLDQNIESQIKSFNLNVCSIISKDDNFEEKKHSLIKSNYFMSPSLIIIYSLLGTMKFDLYSDKIGTFDDKEIYLHDLWPTQSQIGDCLQVVNSSLYKDIYKDMFKGNELWKNIFDLNNNTYSWHDDSTYIQGSKFVEEMNLKKIEIENAGILALLSDFITTNDISSLGQISLYSAASKYLEKNGVKSFEYNSFESRRGNSEVMIRGILNSANLQNQMVTKEGGYTMDYESNEIVSIYDKAQRFKEINRALVIFAGLDFGKGKAKDWAVKGMKLLGVKAIVAKSFDAVYRSNLISVGILPLEFIDDDIQSLKLKGDESITIKSDAIKADSKVDMTIHKKDGDITLDLKCRLDTVIEEEYYKSGGTISFLLKKLNSFI